MLWKEPLCLLLVVVGVVLFLYGANYYDAVVGWTGVGVFVGGIVLYVVLKAYDYVAKKGS
jgi:membrane-bound ClpP family serine protease